MMSEFQIKRIEPQDNLSVRHIVHKTLAEFGLHGEGFAGVDEELNDMYTAYSQPLSAYYMIKRGSEVLGVGGFAPLEGTEPGTVAELRKMYLLPQLRGQGLGQKLIELCINGAKENGYHTLYLETVPAMEAAQALYLKNGFEYTEERMGDSGHSNCHVHMSKSLK